MVNGLDTFRDFFRDYADNYIIIGGTACDILFFDVGLEYRVTKDIDMILIVEALSDDYIIKFWEFINLGKYENKQKSVGKRKYFRFVKPENINYPAQLELFSRKPDFLDYNYEGYLTPIPTDEDLSSLSAILMNDDYYNFTVVNSEVKDGLHIASAETLICLKVKAYLDLKQRKEEGHSVDSRNIAKHIRDVIRLTQLLTSDLDNKVSNSISNDLTHFISEISKDKTVNDIIKSLGIRTSKDIIIEMIKNTFNI